MHPSGAAALGGAQVIRVGSSASAPGGLRSFTLPPCPAAAAAAVEALLVRARGSEPHEVIVVPTFAPYAQLAPWPGSPPRPEPRSCSRPRRGVPRATADVLEHLGHPSIYVIGEGQLHHPRAGTAPSAKSRRSTAPPRSAAKTVPRPATRSRSPASPTAASAGGSKNPATVSFANAARPLDAPGRGTAVGERHTGRCCCSKPAPDPGPLAAYLADIQPAYTSAPAFQPVHGVYNHGWLIGDEHMITPVIQAEIDAAGDQPRKQSAAKKPPGRANRQQPRADERGRGPTARGARADHRRGDLEDVAS